MNFSKIIMRLLADASQYHRTINEVVRNTTSAMGRIAVNITSGMNSVMRNLTQGFGKNFSGMFAKMGKDASGVFGKIGKDMSGAAFRGGGGGGGGFGGMASGILSLVVAMGLFKVAAAGFGLAKEGLLQSVQLAADYKDAQVAFRVMTGDAKTGQDLLTGLQDFAVKTPFSQKNILEQGKQLLAFGVDAKNVLPTLKALGDISAGVGGGNERFERIAYNYGQIVSQGFATGMDIRQFAMAGIGVENFAKAAGVSVTRFKEMVSEGEIGADVIVKAFNQMTGAGGKFNNLMSEMSNNPNAIWNSLKEGLVLALQDVGIVILESLKASGLYEDLTGLLAEFKANAPAIGAAIGGNSGTARGILAGGVSAGMGMGDVFASAKASLDEFFSMFDVTFEEMLVGLTGLPAILTDIFYLIREGFYRYLLVPFTYAMQGVHGMIDALVPGDTGYSREFYTNLRSEFRAQADQDAGQHALETWSKRTAERLRPKPPLDNRGPEVGPIAVKAPALPRDLQKYVDELAKNYEALHGGVANQFGRQATALYMERFRGPDEETMKGLRETIKGYEGIGSREMTEGIRDRMEKARRLLAEREGRANEFFGYGAGQWLDSLRQKTGGAGAVGPSAAYKDSSAAQDIINRSMRPQQSVLEEMRSLLQRANELQEARNRYEEAAAEALKQLQAEGLIKAKI